MPSFEGMTAGGVAASTTGTEMTEFKLWLEFEEVSPSEWDIENDFCNIHVDLADGRHYGINVWTFKFLETAIKNEEVKGSGTNGLYIIPPDLLVKILTRDCIQETIEHLLSQGELENVLNPSVLSRER